MEVATAKRAEVGRKEYVQFVEYTQVRRLPHFKEGGRQGYPESSESWVVEKQRMEAVTPTEAHNHY